MDVHTNIKQIRLVISTSTIPAELLLCNIINYVHHTFRGIQFRKLPFNETFGPHYQFSHKQ